MPDLLSPADRATALAALPGWQASPEGTAITRIFRFKDFSAAFDFMTRVALLAEEADHHPDWSNLYNEVRITLSTHSAHGLTARDVALASRIDTLLD